MPFYLSLELVFMTFHTYTSLGLSQASPDRPAPISTPTFLLYVVLSGISLPQERVCLLFIQGISL